MKSGWTAARLCAAIALSGSALLAAQQLPFEPPKQFGTGITGAFEGWYDNPDGSHTFLVGYLNRNRAMEMDVPIGPNNRIEPGGPDMGQPTHFLPGRQFGMFTVVVPKDFGPQNRLTWTIAVNGQTTQIPLRLHRDYNVSPFTDIAVGNTPPVIKFEEGGATIQGPIASLAKAITRSGSVNEPLPLTLWATDDAKYTSGTNAPMTRPRPPVTVTWSKFRGTGEVTFDKEKPEVEKLPSGEGAFNGKATTNAKFAEAGDYVLHATVNDYSGAGGGGEVCCCTTAMVKVTVK